MAINKATRILVWNKYGKHCAYCGCQLPYKDMQVDHLFPKRAKWLWKNREYTEKKGYKLAPSLDHIDNLMPSCRTCNHYKSAELLESFRVTMKTLYKRIVKTYLAKVALKYSILEFHPWDGKFYFEKFPKRTRSVK